MIRRTAFVLTLDIVLLLLVCVLECISLTGLTAHEWLGFALCPLVLIHVVMQWQWCILQCRKILTASWRDRVNVLLNGLLLILMSAVLLSGVLASTQVTALLGESFGNIRIWHEVHGWLNFALVVAVALHLALNWNWMIAALRRRQPERPALACARPPNPGAGADRFAIPANWLGRGLAVLLVSLLATAGVYFAMRKMLLIPLQRAELQNGRPISTAPPPTPRDQLAPRPRSASFPDGFQKLGVTFLIVGFVTIIGRYVFRLRL